MSTQCPVLCWEFASVRLFKWAVGRSGGRAVRRAVRRAVGLGG